MENTIREDDRMSAPSQYDMGVSTLGSLFSHHVGLYLVFIGLIIGLTGFSLVTALLLDDKDAFQSLTIWLVAIASVGFTVWMCAAFSSEWIAQANSCQGRFGSFRCPSSTLPGAWLIVTLAVHAIICIIVCALTVSIFVRTLDNVGGQTKETPGATEEESSSDPQVNSTAADGSARHLWSQA